MNDQNNIALFIIKFVHSLIFVIVSLAILYVWFAIFAGVAGISVAVAVSIILLEIVVYVGNRLRCPLTQLAQHYGDVEGNDYIADIFLPDWFVPLIPRVCGPLGVVGLIVLLVRTWVG